MGKEKFVYNTKTLRYEKIEISLKTKLIKGFSLFLALAAYTAVVAWIAPKGDSSKEQEYLRELTELRKRVHELNRNFDELAQALENLEQRDAAIYRQVLDMKPTENSDKGWTFESRNLHKLSDQELVLETSKKISALRQKVASSAQSQEEILAHATQKDKMLRSIPSIRPLRLLEKEIQYMSGFGYRIHPVFKIKKMHTGIDFGAPIGTPIYATGDGKVVRIEQKSTGYGQSVVIDHGYGFQTLYAHMSKIGVKVGQEVRKGEEIGKVGNTGTSTAPHVHYEVIRNGEKVNPIQFCMDGLSPQEYKMLVENAATENISLEN